jgi:pimeloyl-ACP methyl ester carboxylesterase
MPLANLPGVRMHYVTLDPHPGIGPQDHLLLVHGLASNLAFWYWHIAPALTRLHRVLMVDLRGHGRSSMPAGGYTARGIANDLRLQLDLLSIPKIHLLAHSFGGRVAMHLASSFPERVSSVILADVLVKSLQSNANLTRNGLWMEYRTLLSREGFALDEDNDDPSIALLEGLARLRLRQDGSRPLSQLFVTGPFSGAAGRRTAVQWLQLLDRTSARSEIPNNAGVSGAELARMKLPALLVYGEHSPALPTGLALQRLWPHARLEIVPRAGHFFPATRPDRLIGPVHAFLTSLRAA